MRSFRSKPVGWRGESHRHYLAAKGIKTYHSVMRDDSEDIVAAKRFGKENLKNLQKVGAGSDRVVYDLGNGKVLKLAKTPRGLEQNQAEQGLNDYTLPDDRRLQVHESGKDYNIVEKANPPGLKTKVMLKDLDRFNQKDFEDKTSELQATMLMHGLEDYMNYDLAWGDFTRKSSWGEKNGVPVLLDGGSLQKGSIVKPKDLSEWSKVKSARRFAAWKSEKDSPWKKDKIKLVRVDEVMPVEDDQSVRKVEEIKASGEIRKPIDVYNRYVGRGEEHPKPENAYEREHGADMKKYQVFNGHHRLVAARERGDVVIPAKIVENPFQRQEYRRRKGLRA